LVELFFSVHCFGCPEARKVLQRLASDRSDLVVVEHNVDDDLTLARSYHLIATPALVIDRAHVLYGVPGPEKLAARIDASAPVLS
jgi:protein-disulfide isomerase